MVNFRNKYLAKVYRYIYLHDDQTLLVKDISAETTLCPKTIRKYIKWLERRGLIEKNGKHFKILPV